MLNNFLFLKKINFPIFRSYLQDLLIFLIVIFSFFVSFDSYINKILLKYMFVIWLISLLFKNRALKEFMQSMNIKKYYDVDSELFKLYYKNKGLLQQQLY